MKNFLKRIPVFFVFFLLLTLSRCGDGDQTYSLIDGIKALEAGKSSEAITFLEAVPENDSEYRSARYALMLAHYQASINSFDVILETISPIILPVLSGSWDSLNRYIPQQIEEIFREDLWVLLYPMLIENVEYHLGVGISLSEEIISEHITLEHETRLPLDFGRPGEDFYIGFTLSGTFGEGEARLLGSLGNSILALTSFLGAHSWELDSLSDTNTTFSILGGCLSGIDEGDTIRAIRALGPLATENPSFLGRSERWRERFGEMDDYLTAFLENIYTDNEHNLIISLLTAPSNRAISIEDLDNSGSLSAPDCVRLNGVIEITLKGVEQFDQAEPFELGEVLPTISPLILPTLTPAVTPANNLIELLTQAFKSVDSGAQVPPVEISDVNPLLSALTLPTLPEALKLDIAALFQGTSGSGKPLRELFPHTDEANHFIVEGEITSNHPAYPYSPCYPPYITVIDDTSTDVPHFSGINTTHPIDPDGICPVPPINSEQRFPINLLTYIAWQDPTVNGALEIDLSQLAAGATGEPSAFSPADNYSLNKLTASLTVDYLPQCEASLLLNALIAISDLFTSTPFD